MKPIFLVLCLPIALVAWWPRHATAQAPPFIDGAFTQRSADNDPDLIVVREAYDPATRRQSIYLRVHDGSPDHEAFSGLFTVTGATVVGLITGGDALAASDGDWGIPAIDYSAGGAARGLEGADPATHVPVLRDVNDLAAIRGPREVRFWLGSRADIDDFRILIEYPPEPDSASFDVLLYGGVHGDPERLPPSTHFGIQVGSLVDFTPDDGDYSEVESVRAIKLRVEDLDILETGVIVGQVDEGVDRAGPGIIHVDNFSDDDIDQDNGFDQNGVITPIPAASDLSHVSWIAGELVGPFMATIPAENVEVVGLPREIPLRARVAAEVYVNGLAEVAAGVYTGRLTVWEDNDDDGLVDRTESSDSVRITVVVGEPTDAGLDFGLLEAGVDAALDGGVDGDVDGDLDGGGDGGPDGQAADGAPDAGDAMADTGHAGDARDVDAAGGDGEPASDAAGDARAEMDLGRPDARVSGRGLGDARGGACDCAAGGHGSPGPAPLLLLFALLAVRGRR